MQRHLSLKVLAVCSSYALGDGGCIAVLYVSLFAVLGFHTTLYMTSQYNLNCLVHESQVLPCDEKILSNLSILFKA